MKLSEKQKLIILLAVVGTITATALVITQTSNELPCGYEVYTERCVEDMKESVIIFTVLEEDDNRTISVPADEIEFSYFISSGDDIHISVRDENRNGEWKISRELGISWTSKEIGVGENVFLPTGEEVILFGFNSEGNPVFNVIG